MEKLEKVIFKAAKGLVKNETKYACWLASNLGAKCYWLRMIKRHPEDYVENAVEDAAKRALESFKALCEYDKDIGKSLFNTYSYDLWEACKILGDEFKENLKCMY